MDSIHTQSRIRLHGLLTPVFLNGYDITSSEVTPFLANNVNHSTSNYCKHIFQQSYQYPLNLFFHKQFPFHAKWLITITVQTIYKLWDQLIMRYLNIWILQTLKILHNCSTNCLHTMFKEFFFFSSKISCLT